VYGGAYFDTAIMIIPLLRAGDAVMAISGFYGLLIIYFR